MYEGRVVAVAEFIPYKSFKEKIRIVKECLIQRKYVEVWKDGVYAYEGGIGRNGRRKKRNVTMSN